MDKLRIRIVSYVEHVKARQEELEEALGKRVSLKDFSRIPVPEIGKEVPITYEIGTGGGKVYGPEGEWFLFRGKDLEKYGELIEEYKRRGGEVLNYQFSENGEKELYRVLGVLKEDQEPTELPAIWKEKIKQERGEEIWVNPRDYKLTFPTNISGVELKVFRREITPGIKEPERGSSFVFTDEFLEHVLAERSER